MADEDLVTELAQVTHAALRDGQAVGMGTDLRPARAVLAWLAGRGRLVPDGARTEPEWTMRYKLNGKVELAEDNGHVFDSREEAELHIDTWRRVYPTLSYTDVEYLRRDRITTPWEPVPTDQEATDG